MFTGLICFCCNNKPSVWYVTNVCLGESCRPSSTQWLRNTNSLEGEKESKFQTRHICMADKCRPISCSIETRQLNRCWSTIYLPKWQVNSGRKRITPVCVSHESRVCSNWVEQCFNCKYHGEQMFTNCYTQLLCLINSSNSLSPHWTSPFLHIHTHWAETQQPRLIQHFLFEEN